MPTLSISIGPWGFKFHLNSRNLKCKLIKCHSDVYTIVLDIKVDPSAKKEANDLRPDSITSKIG
jgi:hypothetical protein